MTELQKDRVDNLTERGSDIVANAEAVSINTADDLVRGSDLLAVIKTFRKEVAETFDKPIADAHTAHKSVLAARKKVEAPFISAERVVKAAIGGYHDRLRIAAEKERRAAEAEQRKRDEDSRLAAAVILEEAGETKVAEAIVDAPPSERKPMIAKTPPPPKTAGVTTQVKHRGVVNDLYAFVAWALATSSIGDYLTIKQGDLDRMIQRKNGEVSIPGLEVVTETQVGTR